MFIDFREREGEKHSSVASCVLPSRESNLQSFFGVQDNAPANGAIRPGPPEGFSPVSESHSRSRTLPVGPH